MTADPGRWTVPFNATASQENAKFQEIREWGRYYVLESFKVRPVSLGSIESHPDFE